MGVWQRFGTKWAIWFQRAEAVCFRVVAVVGLGRFSIEVEGVIAEAVDVLRQVWTDGCDGVFGDGFPALFESLNEPLMREHRLWKIRQFATRWLYLGFEAQWNGKPG